MNKDMLKGKWKEIKGEIKATWGNLTDDDLAMVEGKPTETPGAGTRGHVDAGELLDELSSPAAARYYLGSEGGIMPGSADVNPARLAAWRSTRGYATSYL